jgi:hypothetical protein
MLKKSASFVLASLRGSTCGTEYASPLRHWALTNSRSSANVTLLIRRLADLAAAALDGHIEHPVGCLGGTRDRSSVTLAEIPKYFSSLLK